MSHIRVCELILVIAILVKGLTPSLADINNTQLLQYLVERKIDVFKQSLVDLLIKQKSSNKGKQLYKLVLGDIMRSQLDNFVVLESALARFTLIPQCCSGKDLAILFDYEVLPTFRYKDPFSKVKNAAEDAVNMMETNNYSQTLSMFYHIKEILKIGIAFYNRTLIYISHLSEESIS